MGLFSDSAHAHVMMHAGIIQPVVSFKVGTSQHSWCMHSPQFYIFCKTPMKTTCGATNEEKVSIMTTFSINGLSCVLCKHVIICQNLVWKDRVLLSLLGIESAISHLSLYIKYILTLFILTQMMVSPTRTCASTPHILSLTLLTLFFSNI